MAVCFKHRCKGNDLCVSVEGVVGDCLREKNLNKVSRWIKNVSRLDTLVFILFPFFPFCLPLTC